jgi:uncharacterized repeat protein (TIGR03809 family)
MATGFHLMAQRPYSNALAEVSLKWRDLAERRRAHLIDLYQSGRWRHYYDDVDFLVEMRAAITAAERWAKIAPKASDHQKSAA